MSKRRRQLLQGGGLLLFSAITVAPFLASMVGGEELVAGGAVRATMARSSATATEEEAVLSRTATTGENPLKRKSLEALGHSAEGGGGGGGGGELKKKAVALSSVERQEKLAREVQKLRQQVMERKIQHSETFYDIHNALWRRSVGFGQLTRAELEMEAAPMNRFIDRQIALLQRYESLETDPVALEKARLIRADYMHQKIDTGWLGDRVGAEDLRKWPIPKTERSLVAGGGGGGGGGSDGERRGVLSKAEMMPLMNERQRQILGKMTEEDAVQLVRELEPFHSLSRADVLSSMPDELKKLHSELVAISPELHDVPLMFRSDLELSYWKQYNGTHGTYGVYSKSKRLIKLNRTAIVSKGFSLRSVLGHEVAHALELG